MAGKGGLRAEMEREGRGVYKGGAGDGGLCIIGWGGSSLKRSNGGRWLLVLKVVSFKYALLFLLDKT